MNLHPDIVQLLGDLASRKMGRAGLARWLAEQWPRFFQSANEADHMVLADLDAALGEVQAARANEASLASVAEILASALGIQLPGRPILVEIPSHWPRITSGSGTASSPASVSVTISQVPEGYARMYR